MHIITNSVVGLALLAGAALAAEPRKPNVILFLVDDMGWMDSTPYGSKYYETPNIERLARQGMRFTQAYSQPLCSPTREFPKTGQAVEFTLAAGSEWQDVTVDVPVSGVSRIIRLYLPADKSPVDIESFHFLPAHATKPIRQWNFASSKP